MNEWQKLTQTSVPGYIDTEYFHREGNDYPHWIRIKNVPPSTIDLSDPEALAFTIATGKWREVPQVQRMIATLEDVAGGPCCETEGCSIEEPMCDAMNARAALAALDEGDDE